MFKIKVNPTYIILAVIFALGLFLRIYNLGNFPVGFHIDEANLGYNAYSLLLTGKDDSGQSFPLYISMFNDYNPTGYHYLTILPIKFFGLSEFATRFPAALFGSLTIIAFFFLSLVIFHDKRISLLSALLLAIAPWHINLSRGSAESLTALFFVILGFSLYIFSFQNKKIIYLFLGSFVLSISYFIYPAPRLFIPLFCVFLLAVCFQMWLVQSNVRYRISVFFSLLFISVVSFILVFFINGGTERFNQVSIFTFPETKLIMEEQLREDGRAHSILPGRIFHNKPFSYFLTFSSNYLEYFSGNFLFMKGGLPNLLIIPQMGLIYIVELPFIIFGIFFIFIHKKIIYKIPILWLLIAPVVAAITVDDIPNVRRAIIMFPMIELIAAYGFITFLQNKSYSMKIIIISSFSVLLFLNTSYFLHQYFVNAQEHRTWFRNNGFSEMMKVVKNSYNNYDSIVMSKYQGGIYPLVLFYMKYDPKTYQLEGSPKNKDYGGFGKFFFVPQDCPSEQTNDKTPKVRRLMYIDKGDCPMTKFIALKKTQFIYREDGTKAFRIIYE